MTFLCFFQCYFRITWKDDNCWLHSYPKCQWTHRWLTAFFFVILSLYLSYVISEIGDIFNVSCLTFSRRFFQLYRERKKKRKIKVIHSFTEPLLQLFHYEVKFTFQYCNSIATETQMLCKVVLCYLCFIQSIETGKNPIPTAG